MDTADLHFSVMNLAHLPLHATPYARPEKLYRYSQQQWLERSLQSGEFRLNPVMQERQGQQSGAEQILPFGISSPARINYLTLSLTNHWDEKLFDLFPSADCCLVIHEAEEFGERIHRAAQKILPGWAGIDAAISYGMPSPLGAAFSKTRQHAGEREWLFAWRPTKPMQSFQPVMIQIGSIERIAELRTRSF